MAMIPIEPWVKTQPSVAPTNPRMSKVLFSSESLYRGSDPFSHTPTNLPIPQPSEVHWAQPSQFTTPARPVLHINGQRVHSPPSSQSFMPTPLTKSHSRDSTNTKIPFSTPQSSVRAPTWRAIPYTTPAKPPQSQPSSAYYQHPKQFGTPSIGNLPHSNAFMTPMSVGHGYRQVKSLNQPQYQHMGVFKSHTDLDTPSSSHLVHFTPESTSKFAFVSHSPLSFDPNPETPDRTPYPSHYHPHHHLHNHDFGYEDTHTSDPLSENRRKRRRTSPSELLILERAFIQCPKPTRASRDVIAQRVNMPEKAVQIWFQNKRQAVRKEYESDVVFFGCQNRKNSTSDSSTNGDADSDVVTTQNNENNKTVSSAADSANSYPGSNSLLQFRTPLAKNNRVNHESKETFPPFSGTPTTRLKLAMNNGKAEIIIADGSNYSTIPTPTPILDTDESHDNKFYKERILANITKARLLFDRTRADVASQIESQAVPRVAFPVNMNGKRESMARTPLGDVSISFNSNISNSKFNNNGGPNSRVPLTPIKINDNISPQKRTSNKIEISRLLVSPRTPGNRAASWHPNSHLNRPPQHPVLRDGDDSYDDDDKENRDPQLMMTMVEGKSKSPSNDDGDGQPKGRLVPLGPTNLKLTSSRFRKPQQTKSAKEVECINNLLSLRTGGWS
ncbi:hypothetical protein NADFUDRAFT_51945 [Nadsonia fulvescens var. elongata DSM 6958]|uniref:Homeobox domain-containing protein n=1 Tax=Nadsonia fulvescens var. elongata DSM 6958 TaxID=857566 RepID=A0A1E3PJ81_9ASCO|nr:hypothetical protein NADFUDRAFT_51945 [Nadsonia fulvescens var. elongata DSM 6958]